MPPRSPSSSGGVEDVGVTLARAGSAAEVRASGRLTVGVAPRLRTVLLEAFEGATTVKLVFGAVEEADLSLLQLICASCRSAGARGARFGVDPPLPTAVRRLLSGTGITPGRTCPPGCSIAEERSTGGAGSSR